MKVDIKMPESIGFQLAPMLDVVFLLLIFFVVTHRIILTEQDLRVNVPTAPNKGQDPARAISEIIINARMEGDEIIITCNRQQFTTDALKAKLREQVKLEPDLPVRIRGDAQMTWQKMIDVVTACTEAGVCNIIFSNKLPNTPGS